MGETFLPTPGEPVEPGALTIPRARELAELLATGKLPFVKLLECRRVDGADEVVAVELEVEIGQVVATDIRRFERIAIRFTSDEDSLPDTLAMRADFPLVPHRNLRREEFPRSLCLYEGHPSELLLGWTPRKFIERIREWLAKTAKQTLHDEDQPLEQLLIGPLWPLVIPSDLFTSDITRSALSVFALEGLEGRPVLIAVRGKKGERLDDSESKIRCVAIALLGEPQTHGIIRNQPANLLELHDFLVTAKIDLIGHLRTQFKEWHDTDREALSRRLIVVVALPKTRRDGGEVEGTDFWAFLTGVDVGKVGQEIGIFSFFDNKLLLDIFVNDEKRGRTVELALLDPQMAFTRERAALLNGYLDPVAAKVVAAGMGALGSQVFMNLLRSGFGEWTVVDNDHLLPHNLARHYLNGGAVGWPKARTMAFTANGTIEGEKVATPIVADLLKSGTSEPLTKALSEADLIFDFSASGAGARHRARGIESNGRRISFFLNPAGTDSVLLAEDEKRTISLDCLEMQYYRHLANEESLDGHLEAASAFRYGASCRDVSSTMPQDLVALHAAIGSKAIRSAASSKTASINLWRSDPETMSVTHHAFVPAPMIEVKNTGWTLCTDESVTAKVMRLRQEKLPNETGGILIGSLDMKRKIVYVADAEASPRNSREEPNMFIRGPEGMSARLQEIETATAGNLEYVGEWHSHPAGHGCTPSEFDLRLFCWLVDLMNMDGKPALMLIAGEPGTAWFLGRMAGESPQP
jgi:proteasome lid subunit RPN8/RPN11